MKYRNVHGHDGCDLQRGTEAFIRRKNYNEVWGTGVGMGVTTGFNLVKCYDIVYSMRRMKLHTGRVYTIW